jgi:hypothetical protein
LETKWTIWFLQDPHVLWPARTLKQPRGRPTTTPESDVSVEPVLCEGKMASTTTHPTVARLGDTSETPSPLSHSTVTACLALPYLASLESDLRDRWPPLLLPQQKRSTEILSPAVLDLPPSPLWSTIEVVWMRNTDVAIHLAVSSSCGTQYVIFLANVMPGFFVSFTNI